MKVDNVVLNRAEWSRHGTELQIGFRRSESDGVEDDWVLDSTIVIIPVGEILAFERQLLQKYTSDIDKAIRAELGSYRWQEITYTSPDLSLT